MKISCFLTSFNRPMLLRRALASIKAQTWKDWELFVLDESDIFKVLDVTSSFEFGPKLTVATWTERTAEERVQKNPMSWKLNRSLPAATGDVLVFLCDDDYYYPGWFEAVALYFMNNDWPEMAYGALRNEKYGWKTHPPEVRDPLRELDHCQVAHRRLDPPAQWPESMEREIATAPDGYYFRAVKERFDIDVIGRIDAKAVVKGHHDKRWLKSFGNEPIEGSRE